MSSTNNIPSLFIFQDHDIKVVIHNSEPWFIAKDVCEVPGFADHHQRMVVLSEHQKSGPYLGPHDIMKHDIVGIKQATPPK
jgi:prophage antirepressor-like protein